MEQGVVPELVDKHLDAYYWFLPWIVPLNARAVAQHTTIWDTCSTEKRQDDAHRMAIPRSSALLKRSSVLTGQQPCIDDDRTQHLQDFCS
jgi:hypothetical protein